MQYLVCNDHFLLILRVPKIIYCRLNVHKMRAIMKRYNRICNNNNNDKLRCTFILLRSM